MPDEKKDQHVMIRMEPTLWRQVRDLAHDDRVSASEWVRRLIRRSIAQKLRASGPN